MSNLKIKGIPMGLYIIFSRIWEGMPDKRVANTKMACLWSSYLV